MKLGAKKVKQAELLSAMGADEPEPEEQPEPEPEPAAAPAAPAAPAVDLLAPPPGVIPTGRGSLPPITPES